MHDTKVVNIPYFWPYGNNKTKKVSRLLQKELSSIFHKEAPALIGSSMVSVTLVRVAPDLANANIYLSIFPVDEPMQALKIIKSNGSLIRKNLGKQIRNQLRIVPILEYFLDNSAAYAEEIDILLKK